MVKNLADVLKEYHTKGWFLKNDIRDPYTDEALSSIGWKGMESVEELLEDEEFVRIAAFPYEGLTKVSQYGGVLFARSSSLSPFYEFKEKYPNVVVLDEATLGHCGDKLKSSILFTFPELVRFKPVWNLYSKDYTPELANQIMEDMHSELVVIKPRRAAKGNGVIVCSSENLDETLEYILTGEESLLDDPDASYRYWAYDRSQSFIVESYVPSTPTPIAHLENRCFDPTMRVVYVLVHSDNQINLHRLGSYWKLPEMSLDQEGSLNDLHKSCGKLPYFSTVDPDLDEEVQAQVRECFHHLYHIMLERKVQTFKEAA